MRQLGWIVFIAEHIIITMLPTVEDDELLAALWVAGCHQSGGLVAIYDIGLGLSFHREQISVIPHLQQFITDSRTEGHGGQALLFPFFDMALQPGRDLGKGIPFLLFSWRCLCIVPRLHIQTDDPSGIIAVLHCGVRPYIILTPEGHIRLTIPGSLRYTILIGNIAAEVIFCFPVSQRYHTKNFGIFRGDFTKVQF